MNINPVIASLLTEEEMQQAGNFEYAPRNGAAEEVSLDVHLSTYVTCDDCRPQPPHDLQHRATEHTLREFKNAVYELPPDIDRKSVV